MIRNQKQTYFGEGKINYNKFELRSKKSQKVMQSNHTNSSIRCQRPPQQNMVMQKKTAAIKHGF